MITPCLRSFIVMVAMVAASPLQAGLIHVNPESLPPHDGTSWLNGFRTLQDALAAAVSGDEIWVVSGTYYPDEGALQTSDDRSSSFTLVEGVKVYGGFLGDENVRHHRDPDLNPTILSGELQQNGDSTDNSYSVVTANGLTDATLLDGFTITGGFADGPAPQNRGGGINMPGSTMRIANCRITGNLAVLGGGIFANSPHLEDCVLENNTATINGGGIHFINAVNPLLRVSFRGNSAVNAGGAIFHNGAGTVAAAIECVFIGNAAGSGGAVCNNGGIPAYINCSMQGNAATVSGGAVLNGTSFSPPFSNTVIWGNLSGAATADDASVANPNGATPVYTHCLVEHLDLTTTGTGNLDGTLPGNDPRFSIPVDPADAPVSGGNLRPGSGSPLIDAGDDASSTSTVDIAGRKRFADGNRAGVAEIDIGAHERPRVFYVKAGGPGGGGNSWATASPDLHLALSLATFGDEVWIAAGTYYPDDTTFPDDDRNAAFRPRVGACVFGGFAGNESNLAQRDLTGAPTILCGDINQSGTPDGNSLTVVELGGFSQAASLDGLTVRGGAGDTRGGGLEITGSDITVRNCIIEGNEADLDGGGAHLSGANRTQFINTVFSGNLCGDQGGGVFLENSVDVQFINTSFQGNRAASAGGAITSESSTSRVANTVIWGNRGLDSVPGPRWSIRETGNMRFSHCLVEYINLLGPNPFLSYGNFNGTDPANDPLFVGGVDATSAPLTGAVLRLGRGSPAVDAGTGRPTGVADDVGGLRRVDDGDLDGVPVIDLGAYELDAPIHVDADATGTPADGSSWGRAFNSLQDGLAAARPGMQVWVAQGTYRPDEGDGFVAGDRNATFTVGPRVALYGGFAGIENSLSQRDSFQRETILSGDIGTQGKLTDNSYHVVTATGVAPDGIIDGFTIRDGRADGAKPNNVGAGIYVPTGASPRLSRLRIKGNFAGASGGGLAIQTGGSVDAESIAFSGNRATSGGAVYILTGEVPRFVNCSFQGNAATSTGGAITTSGLAADFINCVAWNNAANGRTENPTASLDTTSGSTSFSHCLWENIALTGNGNLDGSAVVVAPSFLQPASPTVPSPVTTADLRLTDLSDIVNAGDNGSSSGDRDLANADRIQEGTIDLGAYEGISRPRLEVRDAADNSIPDGGTFDLGFVDAKLGGVAGLAADFRVLNRAYVKAVVTGLRVTGTDAAKVTVTAGLPGTFLALSEAPLSIEIDTRLPAGRVQTATIEIDSNDPLRPTYRVQLNWIVTTNLFDTDGDGIDDLAELSDGDPGTDPFQFDTDMDGVDDRTEINLAAVGFDNGTDDSALLALIRANDAGLGLYTESNLRTLAVTQPVISRDPSDGSFRLDMRLLASPDLSSGFDPLPDFTATRQAGPGSFFLKFDPPDPEAYFFQLQIGE